MWIAFSAKFRLIFSFWIVRNIGFESSTNFLLSTDYDLKTAKIPWQRPFNNLNTDRRHCQSMERILWNGSINQGSETSNFCTSQQTSRSAMQMCKYHVFCTNTQQKVSYGRQKRFNNGSQDSITWSWEPKTTMFTTYTENVSLWKKPLQDEKQNTCKIKR